MAFASPHVRAALPPFAFERCAGAASRRPAPAQYRRREPEEIRAIADSAGTPEQDVAPFEAAALERYGVVFPLVPPRYRTPYFAHIWGGGYPAGYYAYLWSEVLCHDAYVWFEENGGMTRKNGQRMREMILTRGNSGDLEALYRAFRGRDPKVESLLRERDLASDEDAGKPAQAK